MSNRIPGGKLAKAWRHAREGRWRELRGKIVGALADWLSRYRHYAPSGPAVPKDEHERRLRQFRQRVQEGGHTGPPREPQWWQSLYKRKIYDLGDSGVDALRDIYSPLYDLSEVDRFVHDEFRTQADHHADKYVLHGDYDKHLRMAFDAIGLDPTERPGLTVLDVGSGAGNTIVPLLRMLPEVKLIASELSPQMLMALKRVLSHHGLAGRCAYLQLNAEELDFAESSFDLVVGGALLHHLFKPDQAVRGCHRVLKPGGAAIFFDPFANGNVMMQMLFQTVLDHGCGRDLPEDTRRHLRGFINTIDVMRGDKNEPRFLKLEDKWLFTREYFRRIGREAGFAETRILPMQEPATQFQDHAAVVLHRYCDLPKDRWPDWAAGIIRRFDESIPVDLKAELLIEGCTIFRK